MASPLRIICPFTDTALREACKESGRIMALDKTGNYPYYGLMIDSGDSFCTCAALRQAARHATRAYDEALAPVGLGLNQYAILAKLDRHGPQGLQALADRLVMDRSTLGHLLRPLQRRKLVTIGIADGDRRGRVIALSAEGATLMLRAKPLWATAEARFASGYGADAAANLRGLLAQVTRTDFGAAAPPF